MEEGRKAFLEAEAAYRPTVQKALLDELQLQCEAAPQVSTTFKDSSTALQFCISLGMQHAVLVCNFHSFSVLPVGVQRLQENSRQPHQGD